MAYFPNGTAGMLYEEQYCYNCRNYRDKGDGRGFGCAIWDAQLLYSYDECNNDGKTHIIDGVPHVNPPLSNAKAMLDMLIPEDAEGFPAECSMFLETPKEEVEARDAEFNRKAEEEAEKNLPVTQRQNKGPAVLPSMEAWA